MSITYNLLRIITHTQGKPDPKMHYIISDMLLKVTNVSHRVL